MKLAIMFSGQGAQMVGMGEDFYNCQVESKTIFDRANQILNWDVKEVCFQDNRGIINQTRYTQSALFTASIAGFEAFRKSGLTIDAVLGFSLGEYSAMVASGVLTFDEALRLVEQRAIYMDECANSETDGMAAVIGLENEKIKCCCENLKAKGEVVEVANDNCPGQVVISGKKTAIEKITPLLKEEGAKRVLPLNVSGAFHSSLMVEAARKLTNHLPVFDFKEPSIPIISNVTANYMGRDEVITNIPKQIMEAVRFRESITKLIEEGFDTFIEIGGKKTLTSFVAKVSREVKTFHIGDMNSLQQTIEALGGI